MTRPKQETVLAGYEVGTGEPVRPPLAHTFVAGQTQLSGKTTTLRAIVIRSGRRALAFVTKRGEEFEGRRIRPYLQREGDKPIHWRLVETILASALGQRSMKYERFWIVNAAKNARSLEDVRRNVERLRAKTKGSTAETYELIGEYLDLVLPEMRELNAADKLELQPGLNVIDVAGTSQQLQAMVIRAALEHINLHESEVLTVFPEAWEFAPRGRVTPASSEAVAMARKGAVLGNFLLADSQDIAGVDTTVRQAASVWMLGVQRELNELKRTLQMIPAGIKKPKPADITSLKLGQFIVCWGDNAVRTYVQPAWMNDDDARAIAMNQLTVDDAVKPTNRMIAHKTDDWYEAEPQRHRKLQEPAPAAEYQLASAGFPYTPHQLQEDPEMSVEDVKAIRTEISTLTQSIDSLVGALKPVPQSASPTARNNHVDHQEGRDGHNHAAADADREPAHLTLTTRAPELTVAVTANQLQADSLQPRGRVAELIADGFFQTPRIGKEAYDYWKDRGFKSSSSRIYEALDSLTRDGFLVRVEKTKFQQHPALTVNKNGRKTTTLTINYK